MMRDAFRLHANPSLTHYNKENRYAANNRMADAPTLHRRS
jgi:hypothetical protein